MAEDTSAAVVDDVGTLAAAGVLAYVTETVGHELIGHGGACLASGGAITALAPLWMRCSVVTDGMVFAGPLFNFVAAAGAAAFLVRRPQAGPFAYLLWLVFVFNLLGACGYLVVGGALRFGDWNALFAAVRPAWLWRVGAVALGATGYALGLRAAARLYARMAGPAKRDRLLFLRRILVPAIAAAIVAVAAELAGGRVAPLALALPLACTLLVGWSVSLTDPREQATMAAASFTLASRGWQIAALVVGLIFVCGIGPAPGAV